MRSSNKNEFIKVALDLINNIDNTDTSGDKVFESVLEIIEDRIKNGVIGGVTDYDYEKLYSYIKRITYDALHNDDTGFVLRIIKSVLMTPFGVVYLRESELLEDILTYNYKSKDDGFAIFKTLFWLASSIYRDRKYAKTPNELLSVKSDTSIKFEYKTIEEMPPRMTKIYKDLLLGGNELILNYIEKIIPRLTMLDGKRDDIKKYYLLPNIKKYNKERLIYGISIYNGAGPKDALFSFTQTDIAIAAYYNQIESLEFIRDYNKIPKLYMPSDIIEIGDNDSREEDYSKEVMVWFIQNGMFDRNPNYSLTLYHHIIKHFIEVAMNNDPPKVDQIKSLSEFMIVKEDQ